MMLLHTQVAAQTLCTAQAALYSLKGLFPKRARVFQGVQLFHADLLFMQQNCYFFSYLFSTIPPS